MNTLHPRPKLSVCITTYNRAQYLKEAIQSVLDQTFANFELLVMDNASEDDTGDVVKSFDDNRLRYYRNPKNIGAVNNTNRGIELSVGDYIAIFHDDDIMLPENLEKKVEVLEKHPSVGLVHSGAIQIDAEGKTINGQKYYCKNSCDKSYIKEGLQVCLELLSGPNFICAPSAIVRRECYERLGGVNTFFRLTPDWELWMRICLFYDSAYLSQPLIKYRWHGGNASASFTDIEQAEEEYAVKSMIIEKYSNRIPNVRELRKSIRQTYGKRVIDQTFLLLMKTEFSKAKHRLRLGLTTYPALLWNRRAILLMIRLFIGESGVNLLRKLKKFAMS